MKEREKERESYKEDERDREKEREKDVIVERARNNYAEKTFHLKKKISENCRWGRNNCRMS